MNKKRILLSIFTGTMAATAFGIINNTTNVSASGVVHTYGITLMYTRNGDMVRNRALQRNTPWQVGETINLNGEVMYQVSTNEFVKGSDVSYEAPSTPTTPTQPDNNQKNNSDVRVKVTLPWGSPVFDDQTQKVDDIAAPGMVYKVGRIVQSDTGLVYYQVSTHGWMVGDLVDVSGKLGNVEQVYGFRPIGDYDDTTVEDIRDDMYNWFGCDWDALESIPDDKVREEFTISNYAGEDIGGTYRRLYSINPNIGGSMYYQP
ncbi:hypothetical protein [Companilactobacillus kedongensis]|uniref:hypothetical protein n=1 Tax=Companilactobacillus kedongensis TaxID=2486004 RepID=UPI000F768F1F|nr:hypothetical protein [Companilactobacillus kedongensis]